MPESDLYICPTTGETESRTMGGFDACCDHPRCPGNREPFWSRCRALTLQGLPCKWLCSPGFEFCARHRAWRDSEETDFCRCEEGSYLGAQLAGTPIKCERCRKLLDVVSHEKNTAIHAQALRRLEAAAEELYAKYPDLRPT